MEKSRLNYTTSAGFGKPMQGQVEKMDNPTEYEDVIFDSTRMSVIGKPEEKGLPRYYFPLVAGILLVEVIVLVFALLDIFPLFHVFEIYPETGYYNFISESDLTHTGVIIIRWFFFLLTAGVLIPVTLIIIMEVIRRFINSRRPESNTHTPDKEFGWMNKLDKSLKNPNITADRIEGDYIKRFDIHQRLQHYGLFISFIILGITGLIRGFPHWPTFAWFTNVLGGPDLLRLIHDGAAIVMFIVCVYHIIYVLNGIIVQRKWPTAMIPNLKDLKDMLHTFLWIFGQRKHEPDYEHFQYGQKIDYWAIFWGMPVMMITGLIMMVPVLFADTIPGWGIAMCVAAHRDEAILAVGFILIVHMYYGHFSTSAFPVNTVMFTGRMLKSKYREWFGREYEQLTGEKEEKF